MAPKTDPLSAGGPLLEWFGKASRDLPWRRDYEPYAVLVSEVMLQQTQMDRVCEYFTRWMRLFPTPQALAEASEEAVLKAWEGLGYYSRAKNLRRAAAIIAHEHAGRVPEDPDTLRGLPGIGPYTAGAVASIAYNHPLPAVDANVERVLSRLCDVDLPVKSPAAKARFRALVMEIMPEGRARDFNQALMELGALVCTKNPRCAVCPLRDLCLARRFGVTAERPLPGAKTAYEGLEIVTGVLMHKGRIFIQKRMDTGAWAGLWEFPGGRLEPGETPEQGIVREYLEETEFVLSVKEKLGIVRHAYTRYRITMHCFLCALDAGEAPEPVLHAASAFAWMSPRRLDTPAMPAGHRKLLHAFGERIFAAMEDL